MKIAIMNPVLFIGGCADGLIEEDPSLPFWQIPVPVENPTIIEVKDIPVEYTYPIETYRREYCCFGGRDQTFYVLNSMSIYDAIWRLILRYAK